MKSFSLVHDSCGAHAGNAQALAEILRDEFLKMYDEDILQKFKEELEE
ncbi:MAG: DNA-directed RNA polymerase [Endozoicomonas sp.]